MTSDSSQSATRNPQSAIDHGQRLKIVVVGHVDHGKSTTIGRILFDTNSLPEGKVEQIRAACEAESMEFEYAFLLDALLEEQAQNITIDTTQIPFKTAKRPYVIIDAPGHKEFLKNMVTGAANADAAFLLIAANEGVQEQSRRHGYLLSLLGIKQVVVLVNKMDLADYSQDRFDSIVAEYTAFLSQLDVKPRAFLPIASKLGINIAARSPELAWFQGPTVVEALDQFEMPKPITGLPLRLPLQDVYRFDDRRILAGRIISGSLKVGDTLYFSPGGRTSTIKSIEAWGHPEKITGEAGESIAITLSEQIFVERGHFASPLSDKPFESTLLRANLFWLGKNPLQIGIWHTLKLATQEVEARVTKIEKIMDASTLQEQALGETPQINRNDVAEIVLETRQPIAFDLFAHLPETGRFVLLDGKQTAGGGIILKDLRPSLSPVSDNIVWSDSQVRFEQRQIRNGHKGAVLWFTGLSGSGKSTLAMALDLEMFRRGMHSYVLDGDNLRFGLNRDLGFSPKDREENIRRASEVAKLFAQSGAIVVTSFISPYRADREKAKEIAEDAGLPFFEIYINAPLEVCEKRDPKKLYAKARRGEIPEFTGISSAYEAPEKPVLEIRTNEKSVEESLTELMEFILKHTEMSGGEPEI
jgi:bifunctional enzyme CysN/CysC